MPTIYSKPDPDTVAFVASVMEDYHDRLSNHGVRVDVLWAESSDDTPALKHNGYPAVAMIKVNDVKGRLRGLADATILLDKSTWDATPEPRRVARIDHELTHLEIQFEDQGRPKLDDAGRPKLKLKPHDFQIGVFDQVLARHGADSDDAHHLNAAAERMVQAKMPWG